MTDKIDTSDVRRFSPEQNVVCEFLGMWEKPDGDYVCWEDYEAIAVERDRLTTLSEEWRVECLRQNAALSAATERAEKAEAENARLRAALVVADEYLGRLQTPGTEPLNSLNQGKGCGHYVAAVRNEAREIWAIVGNVLHCGMTVADARAAMKGDSNGRPDP